MNERQYRLTKVERQAAIRELSVSVAHAIPTLRWRHHGIGVLQAYLIEGDTEVRVHVWHPDLCRRGVNDEGQIHDHRFTLQSSVLFGEIQHDEYILTPDPEGPWAKYTVLNARQGGIDRPDLIGNENEGPYRAEIIEGTIRAGEVYTFPEGAFHRSRVSDLTVTLVTKLDQKERRAMLLVPKNFQPRHGFVDNGSPDIDHYLGRARRALLGEVSNG